MSVEIVFQDSRKRHRAAPPPVMHGIERVHSLKILGVTFTDKLSVKEHLDDVISSTARSMYAIRVLRFHGMPESALQQVFRAVVVSKLTYDAPAWWAPSVSELMVFSTERTNLDSGHVTLLHSRLCSSADDELFTKTSTYTNHILHSFLPPLSSVNRLSILQP